MIISWVVTYLCLLAVPFISNKVWLLVAALFFISQWILTKSISRAILSLLLFTLPFERTIRGFWTPVASHYMYYFGFSLKLILSIPVLGYLILSHNARLFSKWTLPLILITVMVGLSGASALFSPNLSLGLHGFIRIWLGFAIFYSVYMFIKSDTYNEQSLIYFSFSIILLGSILGFMQGWSSKPLNLPLEDNNSVNLMGTTTTDGAPLYRSQGFLNHPNYHANLILMILPICLELFLTTKSTKIRYVLLGFIALSGINLIYTYSRTAWAISGLIGIAILLLHKKFKIITLVCLFLTLLTLNPFIQSRINTLPSIWTVGNGSGRLELMNHSFWMIQNFPFFGVGPNRFTEVMVSHGVAPLSRGFIEPVHNVFLLFGAEYGLPMLFCFVSFLLAILIRSWHPARSSPAMLGIWFGVAVWILNAQFHPLFNQEPSFDLLMMMLGYLYAKS